MTFSVATKKLSNAITFIIVASSVRGLNLIGGNTRWTHSPISSRIPASPSKLSLAVRAHIELVE